MNWTAVGGAVVYLIIGYVWTLFFYNKFLVGKRWSDSDFTTGSAVFTTLIWPLMLFIIGAEFLMNAVAGSDIINKTLRKVYRLDR